MERLSGFWQNNRKKYWFSLIVCALFICALVIVCRPTFETNDDLTLANMFNRSRAGVEAWSNVSGYLYGALLVFLYDVFPAISWHCVVMYLITWVSMASVSYVIQNRFRLFPALALSSALMFVYGYECLIVINFTKVSAMAAAAGVFLVFAAMMDEEKKFLWPLSGAFLIMTGYAVRINEGLGVGLSMTSGGVYLFLRLFGKEMRGRRLKMIRRYLVCLLPVVVLLGVARASDQYAISSSPERAVYKEYQDLRTRLMDHGFPDYDENREVFERLNINENAWKLYKAWDYYDTEKFSADVMKELAQVQPAGSITKETVKGFFELFPDRFFRNPMFLVYLGIIFLLILCGRRDTSVWVAIVYQFALLMAVELFLYSDKRFGLSRVEMGLWLGACLTAILMLDERAFHLERRAGLLIMAAVLAFVQPSWSVNYRRQTTARVRKADKKFAEVSQLTSDKDHLYIFNTGDYMAAWAYLPFETVKEGSLTNVLPLGSWCAKSAPFVKSFEAYGVTNPYRAMVENEKVLVVASNEKTILTYLQDYYDPDCRAVKVGDVGGVGIYSFHD